MRVVGCQSRKVTHKTSAVTRQRDAVSSLLHLYFRSRVLFGCPSSTSLFSPTLDSVMSLQFSAFLFVCFKTRHFFGSHGPLKKTHASLISEGLRMLLLILSKQVELTCLSDTALCWEFCCRPLDLSYLPSLRGSRDGAPCGYFLGQSHLFPTRLQQCLSPGLAQAAGVSATEQKKPGLPGVERGPVRQPIRARLAWRCGPGPPR